VLTARQLTTADRVQVIEDSLRGSSSAKSAWPSSTSAEDISAQVGNINVPTLVIAGELDRVDPPIRLKVELLPRIPQAVMHVLPGTGHLSMLESPDAVASLIAAFCQPLIDFDGKHKVSRQHGAAVISEDWPCSSTKAKRV
jgi:pimeloyl-ACP methyl ester carboxylesterase